MPTNTQLSYVMMAASAGLLLTACTREPLPPATRSAITATTLGTVYLQEGRLDQAESEFRKVVSVIPRAASGYGNLALVFLASGRFKAAEAQIRKALDRDSSNTRYHLMLAKVYQLTGRPDRARIELERRVADSSNAARVYFALAALADSSPDPAFRARRGEYLGRVVALDPANEAARLIFAALLVNQGLADSAVGQLEELRKQTAEPPKEAHGLLDQIIDFLSDRDTTRAKASLDRFREILELTPHYQASLNSIAGPSGPLPGVPAVTFSPILQVPGSTSQPREEVVFRDASSALGLAGTEPGRGSGAGEDGRVLVVADFDSDGWPDMYIAGHLLHGAPGQMVDVSVQAGIGPGSGLTGPVTAAAAGDYDNNGHEDLFVVAGGRGHLLRNAGNGTFRDVATNAGLADAGGAAGAVFVDVDQDGDLDLFLATTHGNRVFRNNLDGTFTAREMEWGLASTWAGREVLFGDFNGDGRLDLFESGPDQNALYINQGQQHFVNAIAQSGLPTHGSTSAATGDYDNDGSLDILIVSSEGQSVGLYRSLGAGTFELDRRVGNGLHASSGLRTEAVRFIDYDNDGLLDLALAGRSGSGRSGLRLHRNMGGGVFKNRPGAVRPEDEDTVETVMALNTTDYDVDGDMDLLVATPRGVHLFRNDGGNTASYLTVTLRALRTGSGKNNTFGIGAKLEVRTGALYQMRVVTGRTTHFGLGPNSSADVVRVEWPNGVPQVISSGTTTQIREEEVLKGSCAFLYAWDGSSFQLVTDIMWRSALGMPLGIMGGQKTYASPGASTEYVRLPTSMLQPKDGRYAFQITEELWETAYLDQLRLVAIDHPDTVQVFVNERYVPPGPTPLHLYQTSVERPPTSATDGRMRNLLSALRHRDDIYAGDLTPTRYQGVTQPHDLILDLGPAAPGDSVFLYLNGWIYPSDASINLAVGQSTTLRVESPSLQVRDARGQWRTVIPDLGFPAGKRKTIITDLTGKFPTQDHRVRIRTNMQIYWDQAFVGNARPRSPVRTTVLEPVSADLHFRGFSKTFRKGGRNGPQWFDYASVSTTPPWRPIVGSFTRYGDVLPLLRKPDDMYVIMAPGDETSVEFDADALPPLPPGWTRDFLVYSNGWIKDSDLNTAFGTSVEPLPFRQLTRYPPGPNERYPSDTVHENYRRRYNTRNIGRPTELP